MDDGQKFVTDHAGFGPLTVPIPLTLMACEIHQDNIEAGWWKQEWVNGYGDEPGRYHTLPRNIGELLCLVHSEISEAYDGWIAGKQDDKLPHRPALEVELADTVIRVLDILGFYDVNVDALIAIHRQEPPRGGAFWFTLMHSTVSNAMEGFRKGKQEVGCLKLVLLLATIIDCSIAFDLDLWTAVAEKRAYNATRADHKPENRAKAGGKQF